jgi:hypothetical protein
MDTVKKITEQIEDGTITTTTRTPGKPSTANFIDAAYDEGWPGKPPAPTIINPAGNNKEGKLQTHSNLTAITNIP